MKKKLFDHSKPELMKLIKLTESNIEKAEIVLAVKGEIVDKLQRYSEVVNNMSIDVLGPLLDRIKAEHGLEAAENFRNSISGSLSHAVSTLMDVKDKISTETLKLTGDITSTSSVEDISVDMDSDVPQFDFEGSANFDDVSDDITAVVPDDRELKESTTKYGIQLESIKGTKGTKYFDSKKEMNAWLTENEKKVKRIIGYINK